MEMCREVLPTFQYAILHADLATVLRRTEERSKIAQSSANPELVRIMHGQFDAIEGVESRMIDTCNKSPKAVVEEFLARQQRGDFN